MRRKVAAICVSTLTLAVSGGALAAGQGQSGSQQGQQSNMQGSQRDQQSDVQGSQQGQQSDMQGSQTGTGATQAQGSSVSGQASASASASGQPQSQKGSAPGTISHTQLSRDQVKMLQRALQDDGRYQGNIDGIIGPKTIAALHNFQAQKGLQGGGSLNQDTLDALGLSWGQLQAVGGRETGQTRQPTVGNEGLQLSQLNTDQVKELQQKLQDLGFYKGQIDGTIGPRTRAALQQFYTRQAQLAMRGMISEDGASALGLSVNAAEPVSGTEQSVPMGTNPNQSGTNRNQATQGSQTRTQQRGTGSPSQPRTQSGTSSPSPATPYDQEDEGRYPEGGR